MTMGPMSPLALILPALVVVPPMSEPWMRIAPILPSAPPVTLMKASFMSLATLSEPSLPRMSLCRLPPIACVSVPSLPNVRTESALSAVVAVAASPASICPRSPRTVTLPMSLPAALMCPTFASLLPPGAWTMVNEILGFAKAPMVRSIF